MTGAKTLLQLLGPALWSHSFHDDESYTIETAGDDGVETYYGCRVVKRFAVSADLIDITFAYRRVARTEFKA